MPKIWNSVTPLQGGYLRVLNSKFGLTEVGQLETICKQEVVQTLKTIVSNYLDWMARIINKGSEIPAAIKSY